MLYFKQAQSDQTVPSGVLWKPVGYKTELGDIIGNVWFWLPKDS